MFKTDFEAEEIHFEPHLKPVLDGRRNINLTEVEVVTVLLLFLSIVPYVLLWM